MTCLFSGRSKMKTNEIGKGRIRDFHQDLLTRLVHLRANGTKVNLRTQELSTLYIVRTAQHCLNIQC